MRFHSSGSAARVHYGKAWRSLIEDLDAADGIKTAPRRQKRPNCVVLTVHADSLNRE